MKIEQDLMDQIPKKEWIAFSHRMIQHGRRVCTARKPKCDECPLADVLPPHRRGDMSEVTDVRRSDDFRIVTHHGLRNGYLDA